MSAFPEEEATVVEGDDEKEERSSTATKKKNNKKKKPVQEEDTIEVMPESAALPSRSSNLNEESVVAASRVQHKFWDTQPVPRLDEEIEDENRAIEENAKPEDLRQEPFKMPDGFRWSELDVQDTKILEEIYTLLNENYVEDDDAMFRFDYSMDFLRWALTPPQYEPAFHVGVRHKDTLMAFITGVPATVCVRGKEVKVVEINYLCVHKKLRSKRLAPVLIKEITRRVNLKGIFQAVYTAGVVLPKPVAECRYWHRSLDPKKLIEVGFSRLAARMTMARTLRLYKLPDQPKSSRLRPMRPDDVTSAKDLLHSYLAKFNLHPKFTDEEFAHVFLPRKDVVDSFVITDSDEDDSLQEDLFGDQGGDDLGGGSNKKNSSSKSKKSAAKKPRKPSKVTDMCSFYHLPSTVIGHEKHKTLKAAYSYYNVATSVPLLDLMRDALVCAKRCGMDVFNALDIMDNDAFLKELKFGIGDGHLQYYLYNWKCKVMVAKDVGLVLL